MLVGYSLILYMIPTAACLIPSLYWHAGMLAIAGLLRSIFLMRNYIARVESKIIVFIVVILIFETLYCVIILKIMFAQDNGKTFAQGAHKVFGHELTRHFID